MPDPIHCPSCRKLQAPQEEFGQLICPECAAVLPPEGSEAGPPAKAVAPGSSALDEAVPVQARATGAMTLLRNNLRSEESEKQSSWLENLLPRRGKGSGGPETPLPSRGRRESEGSSIVKKSAPSPHYPVPEMPKEAPRPAPTVEEAVAAPSPVVGPAPDLAGVPADRRVMITSILTVIAFVSIGSVALFPGRAAWASLLFLLTVGLLGVSVVAILYRRQDRRAFWQGFALFGWGYLVMAFVPWFPPQAGPELPTTRLVRTAHARVTASAEGPRDSSPILKSGAVAPARPPSAGEAEDRPRSRASMAPSAGDIREFLIVGHCAFTLLAALAGSAIARWFYRTDLGPA